jgi:hypothetical protein
MPDENVPIQIETPEGNVEAHEFSIDAAPQVITIVAAEELDQLKSYAAQGPGFAASYLQNATNPTLKDYDQAFRAWQLSDRKMHTSEEVTAILGGVLGEKCVADLGMEWVTVSDEYGEDYAVRSKTVEAMGFPFSTVLKRIEAGEWDFMYGVYYALKHQIESPETGAR